MGKQKSKQLMEASGVYPSYGAYKRYKIHMLPHTLTSCIMRKILLNIEIRVGKLAT
jgi:hypothetical protein